jgi:hypothetical protein
MRALSAEATLRLPVRLHGIPLGRAIDILLDRTAWRVLGFVVLCGDATTRFVAWPAVTVRPDEEIAVASALMLLEDVEFYRSRGRSFRELVGRPIDGDDPLGDLSLAPDGHVEELVVGRRGMWRRLPPPRSALAGSGEAA